jgi:ABC-type multidrug transport system fused ATPase/permease subunit
MQKTAFLLDKSQKPMYLLFCVQRWLLLVLSLMAVALVVLLMGVAIPLRDTVSSGFVGLALVQVTTLTDMMNTLVVQWTEMESCLGAVTRISHFTKDTPREGLPAEAAHSVEEWPAEGAVVMENVSASYEYVYLTKMDMENSKKLTEGK